MDCTFKRWEIALMLAVIVVLFGGVWLREEQHELAEQMIRLHVIANSDSKADQTLKLAVRDRVLEQAQDIYDDCRSREQAQQRLEACLPQLEQAGAEVIAQEGYDYPVRAELTECWFPTKEYDGFALPAGEYTALRVVIGEGKGQNWWCVAFPPLCVGAASQSMDEVTEAGYFTQEQCRLMAQEEGGYLLKFRGMELLGELQESLPHLGGMHKEE